MKLNQNWQVQSGLIRGASAGNDSLSGTSGADSVNLLAGNDRFSGFGGNDQIRGGAGNDLLFGGAGADWLQGDGGADTMVGGLGNDVYWVDGTGDRVRDVAGGGRDLVMSTVTFTLGINIEELRLWGAADASGYGNDRGNLIVGNGGDNRVSGRGGADDLNGGSGNDTVLGGTGADRLRGGSGLDELLGGRGADTLDGGLSFDILRGGADTQRDTFVFGSVSDSRAFGPIDVIFDFASGIDRIDLSGIDANTGTPGDQRFTFGGQQAAAHGVWFSPGIGQTLLLADVTGDGVQDFALRIAAAASVAAGDLVL